MVCDNIVNRHIDSQPYNMQQSGCNQIDMEDVHEISLVKYDILGLKNIGIIKDACTYAHRCIQSVFLFTTNSTTNVISFTTT